MSSVPTDLQIELFRAVEDIHELTGAITVLLVDADGGSVAVAGDEDDVPTAVRAVLGGKRLAAAGSVIELLSSVDLAGSPLNVSVFDVDGAHVLSIVFDAEADIATVQSVGRDACAMLAALLSAPP